MSARPGSSSKPAIVLTLLILAFSGFACTGPASDRKSLPATDGATAEPTTPHTTTDELEPPTPAADGVERLPSVNVVPTTGPQGQGILVDVTTGARCGYTACPSPDAYGCAGSVDVHTLDGTVVRRFRPLNVPPPPGCPRISLKPGTYSVTVLDLGPGGAECVRATVEVPPGQWLRISFFCPV